MKAFIWNRVEGATDNWHSEGGLFVVAPDLEEARALLKSKVPLKCGAFGESPDHVLDLVGEEIPRVVVFPDAGCC